MLTTPQTPLPEQPTTGQEAQQPVQQPMPQQVQQPVQQPMPQTLQQPLPQAPMQQPNVWQPMPPIGGYGTVAPPISQAAYLQPTGGQRMGLAIASLALMIPLIAIALGITTSLMQYVASGVAVAVGLFAFTLVCLTVIAVNALFNWDAMRRRR